MSAHSMRRGALAVALSAAAVAVAGCGSSSSSTSASVALKPVVAMTGMKGMKEGESMPMTKTTEASGMVVVPSSAHGSATLTQKGDHLTGTITVSGLAPNSRHAEHLHGPDGSCEPKKMTPNMAVVLPDLEANSKGTAVQKIDLTVHQKVVEPGYFIMVHQKPTPPSERNQIGSAPASPAFMQALSNDPGILCGDVKVSN